MLVMSEIGKSEIDLNFLVNQQEPEMRQKYFHLKDTNEHLLKQLESGQQELDTLNTKLDNLQEVSCSRHFYNNDNRRCS